MGKENSKAKRITKKDKILKILNNQEKIREKWDTKIQDIVNELPKTNKKANPFSKSKKQLEVDKALNKIEEEKLLKEKLTKEEQWVNNYFKDFTTSKNINYEYSKAMEKLLKDRGITQEMYMEKMMAERTSHWRLINEIPSLEKLIAFCVVFEIDIQNLSSILLTLGITFKLTDPIQYAYYKLVEDYKGHSIYECNLLLKQIGILDEYLLPDPMANKKTAKN